MENRKFEVILFSSTSTYKLNNLHTPFDIVAIHHRPVSVCVGEGMSGRYRYVIDCTKL